MSHSIILSYPSHAFVKSIPEGRNKSLKIKTSVNLTHVTEFGRILKNELYLFPHLTILPIFHTKKIGLIRNATLEKKT